MANPKVGSSSARLGPLRFGRKPAEWIFDIASKRGDMDVEIIDLLDFPMPFFDEVASNAWAPTQNEVAVRWQQKIGAFDGYIFANR